MFGCARCGPRQNSRVERSRFALHRRLIVQIDFGRQDLTGLRFVLHRMPAFPAESVLLFDLRSTFRTRPERGLLFLRGEHRRGFGLFTLDDWRLWRWLYDWRRWFLLQLFLHYLEETCCDESPAVRGTRYERGLNDLNVAGVRVRAVIVILVKLVEVTLA